MEYDINIENEDRPLEKKVFIQSNNTGIYSWFGGDYIEIETSGYTLNMNKDRFLELYEMMTTLKKFIND
jgi:hypothetical protein